MEREFFRIKEIHQATGIPLSTLYQFVERGELKSTRIGSILLIPSRELERLRQAAQ